MFKYVANINGSKQTKSIFQAFSSSTACEDGCTGILLKDFDHLSSNMEREMFNIVTTGEPPWKTLKEMQNKVSFLEADLRRLEESERVLKKIEKNSSHGELLTVSRNLREQVRIGYPAGKNYHINVRLLK